VFYSIVRGQVIEFSLFYASMYKMSKVTALTKC
jgi:hypothetical protein